MERIRKAGLTENEAGYLWMDDSLGVLLDKLDELGIADNTLILFTADHGSSNKGSLYKDRGTEVPCIMRWPAGMKKGVRCQELLQNTDFVPTWFDLAGIKPPKNYQVDGVSLKSLFKKPDLPVRPYVYSEMGAARSIKTKRFSYLTLRYTKDQVAGLRAGERKFLREVSGLSGGVSRAILTKDHALTYDQLYDLQKDPETLDNLAGKKRHAATLESMKSSLKAELSRFPDHPYGEFLPGGNAIPGAGYDEVFDIVRTYVETEKKKRKKK
jgi:arylsulfatase A-like enzyme